MSLPTYVSRNGALISPAEALIPVFNPALYGAYGVYESIPVFKGIVFAQRPHLERLARSADIIELPLPADLPAFERWIADLLTAHGRPDCTLRIFVVGANNNGESTVFIWPQPAAVYPAEFYTAGATAITFEARRCLPEAKSLNSLASYLAQKHARAAGVHEALLHHGGCLTEGSNSNLFAVLNGVLLTAPAGQVLSGVTRTQLMALAAQHGVTVRERRLRLADLRRWTECFITSSSRRLMPITVIDGQPVGDGRVGPVTRRLMAIFDEFFQREIGNA